MAILVLMYNIRGILTLLFLFIFFFIITSKIQAQSNAGLSSKPKIFYVIPIEGDIEESMTFLVRRGVKEALEKKADALILHINTNGGRVDSTEKIIQALNRFEPRMATYTFVDTKALSAGALISSATHKIYMAPSSVIGALTPIMMSQEGGVAQLPESVEAKMTSAVKALVRANAERNGHDPRVFDAMVDRAVGLEVEGKTVIPKGQILTLTTQEAAATYGKENKPLLSAGTYLNLDELAQTLAGGRSFNLMRLEPTGLEEVARWISWASPILLSLAFLFGYIEFKTPGFGIFGALSILCAMLFFFGHYIAGLSGYENMLLFIFGALLLGAEIFFFPGTVLLGLSGTLLILISFLRAMADLYPTDPMLPTLSQLQLPLANLGIALVLSLFGLLILARILPKTSWGRGLVLAQVNAPVFEENSALQRGQVGRAQTPLRPSGTAFFDEKIVDVVTQGDFIRAGDPIRIVLIEANRVVVERLG